MDGFLSPQNNKVYEKAGYRSTKIKKTVNGRFLVFCSEAEVEPEAVDEIAASTSLIIF